MTSTVKIPEGWIETTLGEVCDSITDTYSGNDENVYLVNTSDVLEGKLSVNETSKNENLKGQFKKTFKKDDILFSEIRPANRRYAFVNIENTENYIASTKLMVIRSNTTKIIPRFLYVLITSDDFLNEMQMLAESRSGTFPQITFSGEISGKNIILPPLPEQKAIAGVLSAFDDKIELLRAENQTLEEMGQTLFKEWFRPPYPLKGEISIPSSLRGENSILSPLKGEIEPAHTLKGEVNGEVNSKSPSGDLGAELPDGWKEYELSELVDTINGYSYKGNELVEKSSEALVTLKSFDRNGGFQTRGFKEFKGNPKSEQEVFVGDLVVAHTDLTQDAEVLGNPAFIVNNGGFGRLYITMDLVKVNSKNENITKSFLYFLMRTKEFKGHCVGYSNGTTVLHLSKKAIPEYKIVLPKDLSGLKEKSLAFELIMKKISHNFSQIDELIKARDQLLPKLMSGEVRVEF